MRPQNSYEKILSHSGGFNRVGLCSDSWRQRGYFREAVIWGIKQPNRERRESAGCCERAGHHKKVLFSFYLPADALALPKPSAKCGSARAGKKKFGARKIKIAKKVFL